MKSRWIRIAQTSPSGKLQFVCAMCGRVSVTPDKTCQILNGDKHCESLEEVWDGNFDNIPGVMAGHPVGIQFTDHEKELFIFMATMGVTMGLHDIFEWYRNYVRSLSNFVPFEQIAEKEEAVTRMMLKFMWMTEGPTQTPMTKEEMFIFIENYEDTKLKLRED